jgi:DNA-binding transcriptional regulator/RsmH inhibitor MraZ
LQGAQAKLLPVLEKAKKTYTLWFGYRETFPKNSRYTLGDRIDRLFLDILELLNLATYQKIEDKLQTLSKTILKLDALKFFLMISWEVKLLDNKKYIILSEHLQELGRMIGGWKKGLETKTTH